MTRKSNPQHVLDISRDIVTIARAVRDRTLQCYDAKHGVGVLCRYAGPCAVGICVPEEIRPGLDKTAMAVNSLFDDRILAVKYGDSCRYSGVAVDHWIKLQNSHDSVVRSQTYYDREIKLRKFEEIVEQLRLTYAPDEEI